MAVDSSAPDASSRPERLPQPERDERSEWTWGKARARLIWPGRRLAARC